MRSRFAVQSAIEVYSLHIFPLLINNTHSPRHGASPPYISSLNPPLHPPPPATSSAHQESSDVMSDSRDETDPKCNWDPNPNLVLYGTTGSCTCEMVLNSCSTRNISWSLEPSCPVLPQPWHGRANKVPPCLLILPCTSVCRMTPGVLLFHVSCYLNL